MSIATLREAMLWSLVINYGVLLIWFAAFTWGHDRLFRLHSRWFQMYRETFDALHYGSMAVYKIGILLLNLVPLVALWLATD